MNSNSFLKKSLSSSRLSSHAYEQVFITASTVTVKGFKNYMEMHVTYKFQFSTALLNPFVLNINNILYWLNSVECFTYSTSIEMPNKLSYLRNEKAYEIKKIYQVRNSLGF